MYPMVSTCAAAQLFSASETVQALPGRALLVAVSHTLFPLRIFTVLRVPVHVIAYGPW